MGRGYGGQTVQHAKRPSTETEASWRLACEEGWVQSDPAGGKRWTNMCQDPDCPSSAQGDGQGGKAIYCVKHGGGARCQEPDCPSSPLPDGQGGKAIFCITHGGGARCQEPDCPSAALGDGQGGKAIYCVKHGGGPRCQVPDCPTSAKCDGQGGKAIYCVKHGGGALCQVPDCPTYAHGDGQGGKAIYCKKHGGGRRCPHPDHGKTRFEPFPPLALPIDDEKMCSQHFSMRVNKTKTCRAIRREKLCLGSLLCELVTPPCSVEGFLQSKIFFALQKTFRVPPILPWQRFQCLVLLRTV